MPAAAWTLLVRWLDWRVENGALAWAWTAWASGAVPAKQADNAGRRACERRGLVPWSAAQRVNGPKWQVRRHGAMTFEKWLAGHPARRRKAARLLGLAGL